MAHAADEEVDNIFNTDQPDEVVLNADRVAFDDESGKATAEGNAVLTYGATSIEAERIEYDADTQKVKAMPLPGEHVVIKNNNRSLRGNQLDYDLVTQEGVLGGAHTKLAVGEGTLFVYGSEINVIPWELAEERGLVTGTSQGYVAEWNHVTLTTCTLDHPHYRLVSKKVSFVPGKTVRAKNPKLYLGNTYIVTYPFDYVVELKRRALRYSIWPYFQRSSKRGTGLGVTGTFAWETGKAAFDVAWASKIDAEFRFEVEQQLDDHFSIFARLEYSWEDLWDEKVWKPMLALKYQNNGWTSEIRFSRKEYISEQKNSHYEYKGHLDRKPEFIVTSPWFRSSQYSYLNVFATYGHYTEEVYKAFTHSVARYGLGLRNYFEYPLDEKGNEFFSDLSGVVFLYGKDDANHEMLRSFSGFRYKIGAVELGTAYERVYTWGESAMYWDEFVKRERVHQKIRFPIGREFYIYSRGSYDFVDHIFDETIYGLQWVSDCMVWDLYYRRDNTSGGDNQLGLLLSLRAFPDNRTSLGQNENKDPFLRPTELPKK